LSLAGFKFKIKGSMVSFHFVDAIIFVFPFSNSIWHLVVVNMSVSTMSVELHLLIMEAKKERIHSEKNHHITQRNIIDRMSTT